MTTATNQQHPARRAYPDVLRIVAVYAMVWLHTCYWADRNGALNWWFVNVTDCAVRCCVPIFVMVSGVFLLDPARTESIGSFLSRRFSRVLIPLIAWSALYHVWGVYFFGTKFSWVEMITKFFHSGARAHLWFLYMILGLYLATPILRPVAAAGNRIMAYFLSIWVYFAAVRPALIILQPGFVFIYDSIFALYVGYYVGGYWLDRIVFERKRLVAGLSLAGFMACLAFSACGNLILARKGIRSTYFLETNSFGVVGMSLSGFLFFKHLPYAWLAGSRLPAAISNASFGVYLIHFMALDLITNAYARLHCGWITSRAWVFLPLTTTLAFAASLLVVLVIMKIPLVRRIVG